MKAKLLIFLFVALLSGNVFAEYYLVYPAYNPPCGDCYQSSYVPRHHRVYHKKTTHVVHHRRHHTHVLARHYPCGGVVRCSTCGQYVDSPCGRPDYVVYTARPSDCETYEGVEAGEQYSW